MQLWKKRNIDRKRENALAIIFVSTGNQNILAIHSRRSDFADVAVRREMVRSSLSLPSRLVTELREPEIIGGRQSWRQEKNENADGEHKQRQRYLPYEGAAARPTGAHKNRKHI